VAPAAAKPCVEDGDPVDRGICLGSLVGQAPWRRWQPSRLDCAVCSRDYPGPVPARRLRVLVSRLRHRCLRAGIQHFIERRCHPFGIARGHAHGAWASALRRASRASRASRRRRAVPI